MGSYTGTQTDFEHVSNVNLLQLRVTEGPGGYAGPDVTLGSCIGSPEGVIIGWRGDVRFDIETPALWQKTGGEDATAFGWTPIGASNFGPALAALQAQVSALEADVLMLQAQVLINTADISTLQNEPYVTIGNSGTLANERALTGSPTVAIQDNGPNSTVVASVPANAITNTELADMPATSVKANPTGLLADPQDVQALVDNTFFGRQAGVLGFFAVAGAALPQSFVTVSAEASLANERVATSSTTISVVDNGPGTTVQFNIVVNSVDNTLLSDMAALSVKANPTALVADPQDVAAAADNTFFGRVGGVLGFFTVSAGALPQSFVTTNAEASLPNERVLTSSSTVTITDNGAGSTVVPSVPANAITNTELADMPANTVKSNPTAAPGDPQDLAMATNTVLLRAGGNISAFAVGTNTVLGRVAGDIVAAQVVTAQVGDDQITNAKLANMNANTVKANATAASDNPTDVAMATNTIFAREGGDISPLAVGTNEVPLRAGANLTTQAMATNTALVRAGGDITALAFGTNEVMLRAGGNLTDFAIGTNTVLGRVAGDIVAAQVVTGQVGDAQITDAKLANMGARTVKGRSANSSGVPADIAGAGAATFLRDSGTALAFSTIAQSDVVNLTTDLTTINNNISNIQGGVLRVEFDIDCTAQATNDWNAGGDGNYALGGFTWAIVHTDNADTFGPVLGTGLRFNASATVTTLMDNTTQTATRLQIAMTTLIPTFDPLGTYQFELYFSSITLGTSGDQISPFVWNTVSNRIARGGRRNSSGTQQTMLRLDGSEQGSPYTDDAFGFKINANVAASASGTYAAGFPNPYTHLGSNVTLSVATPLQNPIFDPTNALFGICYPSNIAGNADSTLARIRGLRIA